MSDTPINDEEELTPRERQSNEQLKREVDRAYRAWLKRTGRTYELTRIEWMDERIARRSERRKAKR